MINLKMMIMSLNLNNWDSDLPENKEEISTQIGGKITAMTKSNLKDPEVLNVVKNNLQPKSLSNNMYILKKDPYKGLQIKIQVLKLNF